MTKAPLTQNELQAILESLSVRMETLEANQQDRITINMHHGFARSIPPKVRKHAPTVVSSGVWIALLEAVRYLVEHWR